MATNDVQKTLVEFEKRYNGDPSKTESICREIAEDWKVDPERVMDIVYVWRYEDEFEEDEVVEEIED